MERGLKKERKFLELLCRRNLVCFLGKQWLGAQKALGDMLPR